MDQRIIDLHVHSTESDGTFTPEELILEAKKAGLSAMALTDHDTCSGVQKAIPAAQREGIELIPGIELSTDYNGKEVHIVGLFIDTQNQELLAKTAEFRNCREHRNELIVSLLQKEGFDITMEALQAENPDCVITRANIARFMLNHGMIKSMQEAFDCYIGDYGKCYVNRFKTTAMEGVRLIKEAGGIAILAHPVLYRLSDSVLEKLVIELKSAGLDGLEAVYATYSTSEEREMKQLASRHHLLISGGSDFHGENKPQIHLGTGKGKLYLPYSILEAIKEKKTQQ